MIRAFWTILIALLVLYAPAELTRIIIVEEQGAQYVFEIAFIWTFYAAAVTIVYKLLKGR